MLTLHRFTAMALAIAWVAPVHALCLDGRAPTHAQEAATATGVLLVRVLSATPVTVIEYRDAYGDPYRPPRPPHYWR